MFVLPVVVVIDLILIVDAVVGDLLLGRVALAEGALLVDLEHIVTLKIEVGVDAHVGALAIAIVLLVLLQGLGHDSGEVALTTGTHRLSEVAGRTHGSLDHVLGTGNTLHNTVGIEVNITAAHGCAQGKAGGVDGIDEVGITARQTNDSTATVGQNLGGVQTGDTAQLVAGMGSEVLTSGTSNVSSDTLSNDMDDLVWDTLVGQLDQCVADHGTGAFNVEHSVTLEVRQSGSQVNDLSKKDNKKDY